MSTIHNPRAEPAPGSQADPFRYGWRYVPRKQPDGRVPLTLEDLLFPEEGDQTPQYPSHVNDSFYLKAVFDARLAGDPEAVVLSDCRVDWNLPGVRPLGPDIAVFFGVAQDFDRGTLWLEPMGLWLAVDDRRVVRLDGQTGEPIGGYAEQVRARAQAEARVRADAEVRIAEVGTRVDELSRAVEKLSGIVDAQNRMIDAQSRGLADVRATAETQARLVDLQGQIRELLEARLRESEEREHGTEARLREAEAELRRLRGEG